MIENLGKQRVAALEDLVQVTASCWYLLETVHVKFHVRLD